MQALPYIIAGLGTVATITSQQDAAQDRRRILNNQLEASEKAADKSAELVLSEAQQFDPNKRKDAMQAAETKVYDQQLKDLQAGAGGAEVGAVATSGDAGNVSDDFLKAKAEKAVSEGNRMTSIARELAKTRAPGQLQMNESLSQAKMAGELQGIGSQNRRMANASGLDAQGITGESGFGAIASAIAPMVGSYTNAKMYPTKAPAAGVQF